MPRSVAKSNSLERAVHGAQVGEKSSGEQQNWRRAIHWGFGLCSEVFPGVWDGAEVLLSVQAHTQPAPLPPTVWSPYELSSEELNLHSIFFLHEDLGRAVSSIQVPVFSNL